MTEEQFQERVIEKLDRLEVYMFRMQARFDQWLAAKNDQIRKIDKFIDNLPDDADAEWWRDGREPPI